MKSLGIIDFLIRLQRSCEKMDQKWPNSYFQSQSSMSNIDFIYLRMIFYLEYWISRTYFHYCHDLINSLLKTLFSKKGPIFDISRVTKNKSNGKIIFWYQLFIQK